MLSILFTANAVLLLAITASLPSTFANPVSHGHDHLYSSPTSRGVSASKLYCGNFANADGSMANSLIKALGEGSLQTRSYSVTAHGCNRVNCYDTSGIYVCNDNSHSITVTGEQVHNAAQTILAECCAYSQTGAQNKGSIMAGQQFTQNNWNVVIGYADCNQAITQEPSDVGGYGVNGGTCMPWGTTIENA